jgi:hypothetical protein
LGICFFAFTVERDSKDQIQAAGGSLADAGWTASGHYNFAKQNWTSPFQRTISLWNHGYMFPWGFFYIIEIRICL